MVPNVIERVWVQGTTTKVESLRGTAFTEEDGAHTFRIAGVDASGETIPLSGTVLAKILRADNITIDVSGTITDGVASVTMVGDCYHVPGRFSIVVYLSDGVTTIAIYAAVGDIYRATSDTELDSGTTVPSLVQLEAAYQNALSAATAANTAATGAERVNVSMSKSGDTITFSATDRTGATTTETMSDQSETVANLNSALSDVEELTIVSEEVENSEGIYSQIVWEQGYYTLAGSYNSSDVIRHTQKMAVNVGDEFTYGGLESIKFRYVTAYNGNTAVSASGAESTGHYTVPDGITHIIISDYNGRGTQQIYRITKSIVKKNALDEKINSNENAIVRIYNGDYKNAMKLTEPVLLGDYSVGDVVDVSPLESAGTHYTLIIDNLVVGESFYINLVNGNTARPWAFLDKDYKLLSMAKNAYAQKTTIYVPENATYLVLQCSVVDPSYYSNAFIKRKFSFNNQEESTNIVSQNDYNLTIKKLENASNSAKNDTATAIKSRANLLNLLHFSDIHGDVENIKRLLYFAEKYNLYISDIIHTGDAVQTYFGNDNPFAEIGGDKILEVIGNHECWIQGDTWPSPYNATAAQVYEKFIAPFISHWGVTSPGSNLCYYYKDYSVANTRLIVLDALHYDSSQENWFSSVLASAITSELRVIVATHYPSQTGITGFDCTFNSITQTIAPVSTPPQGTQIERMPESAFSSVDTFIENGGEFVCWLSGHTHDDFIGVVTGHTNQIQVIISTARCDNKYSDCARTQGTVTQDLFNVFTVDGNAKLIKIIRIGSTMDKFMRNRNTLCINYQTKNIISNN